MKQVKLGIVGCGYVAQQDYFPFLSAEWMREQVEVTAVCDLAPGRAESVCKKYNVGYPYTDFEQMLKEAEMDLLAILTPIPLHYRQALQALEAGVHVYVQKTMTTTLEEAAHLNEIASKKGLLLGASPGQMLDPYHQETKRILDRQTIGKICFVRGQGPHPGHENQELNGIDPSWYYKPGGGPLMDVAVYPLTSITGLLGPAKRVTAFSGIAIPDRYWEGKKLDIQVDDNTAMLLDFGDGVFASVQGNFVSRAFQTPQVEIYGSGGVIYVGGWTRKNPPLEVYTPETGWNRHDLNLDESALMKHTVRDLLHMTECVRGEKTLLIPGSHAAHIIEIIEKAYESARSGVSRALETSF